MGSRARQRVLRLAIKSIIHKKLVNYISSKLKTILSERQVYEKKSYRATDWEIIFVNHTFDDMNYFL